jgi:Lipocalin-like domain
MRHMTILLLAALLAGCTKKDSLPEPRLESLAGTNWELVEYYDSSNPAWTPASTATLTLRYSFLANTATSVEYTPSSGSKTFTDPYLYSGGVLTFNPGTGVAIVSTVLELTASRMEWEYSESGKVVAGLRFKRIK